MTEKLYDKFNGRDISVYTIKSENIEADILDMGARVNALRVGGRDIALGFDSCAAYSKSGSYAGATVGRVANRIAGGRFVLGGRPYFLTQNDGNNHLHGGNSGFDKKLFSVIRGADGYITLRYVSGDGEENYPGKLIFTVTFTAEKDALAIDYSAVSDKDTLWCPTNHIYFNLDGENSGNCRNNLLRINADYYTPTTDELLPTGEKLRVKGTVFDFGTLKPVGADFGREELKATNGYDHNFILNGEHAAQAESAKTGIKMDLYTDLPCMQFYTGGALGACAGKTGNYGQWSGFCLEPQFCPNAINLNGFDKPILKKNTEKSYFIKLKFSGFAPR